MMKLFLDIEKKITQTEDLSRRLETSNLYNL